MEQEKDQVFNSYPKPKKSQICRFYLRGLCFMKSSECYFAHGVWDLIYEPWIEGEKIDWDYSKVVKENKEQIVKGPRNYTTLFDYQTEKTFTLDELNQDREKRLLVRNQMHLQMYNDFMDLLQCYYPDALFTEEFLLREFTRVGFNKPMSILKLSHICSYVCDPPSSRFFKISLMLPPHEKKEVNYLLKCSTEEQNLDFYRGCYEQFKENLNGQELTEVALKKYLFSAVRPSLNISPLNLYLKNLKMSFSSFIKTLTNNEGQIIDEVDEQTLLKSSKGFICKRLCESTNCSWNEVYKYICQEHKVNNGKITNPLKPLLITQGFIFLNFPMIQFITSKQHLAKWEFQQGFKNQTVCSCDFKDCYSEEELMIEFMSLEQLAPKESLDIFDMESLLLCANTIMKSPILAVDLQGRLRKNGYIEMIQINTGMNTFLIDIHRILMNNDFETFDLIKRLLRNVFCNPKILKIFHDCRHDSLTLHEIMNTCIINVFDTSAVQTYINQLNTYQMVNSNKQILKIITNVKSSGLNQLLKKYNAPHGLNKNKEWFHQLWKKGRTELFQQRPLHPEYRDYCIKDVLDLPYLMTEMSKNLNITFCDWISSHYVKTGYLYLQEQ